MHAVTHNPRTDERVPRHTSEEANRRIYEQTLEDVREYIGASRTAIDARIDELRREWDTERTLEANAATIALIGVALGTLVNKRFFALPAIVAGFLLQHAVQGWCPPLPVLRRYGVRTSAEIHAEMLALRLLRGDFGTPPSDAEAALAQARH